jgi:hypothetical protein
MREFASSHGHAAQLSLPARILYTVFAALTLAGCLSCVLLYDGMVRFDAKATPHDLGSRLIDRYATLERARLVETTHAHLFSMPVLLLVAGHLFLLSRASPRAKVAAVSIAAATTALHLLAPWLVVWTRSPASALIYPISGGLLLLAFTVLLVVPVREMWLTRREAPRGS